MGSGPANFDGELCFWNDWEYQPYPQALQDRIWGAFHAGDASYTFDHSGVQYQVRHLQELQTGQAVQVNTHTEYIRNILHVPKNDGPTGLTFSYEADDGTKIPLEDDVQKFLAKMFVADPRPSQIQTKADRWTRTVGLFDEIENGHCIQFNRKSGKERRVFVEQPASANSSWRGRRAAPVPGQRPLTFQFRHDVRAWVDFDEDSQKVLREQWKRGNAGPIALGARRVEQLDLAESGQATQVGLQGASRSVRLLPEGEYGLTVEGSLQLPRDLIHSLESVEDHAKVLTQTELQKLDAKEVCPICHDTLRDSTEPVIELKCSGKHLSCASCMKDWFKKKPKCPICGESFGSIGTGPQVGAMHWKVESQSCAGHWNEPAIHMTFEFPSGIVPGTESDPQPERYKGRKFDAYLPATKEGIHLFHCFKRAFRERVLFSIGVRVSHTNHQGAPQSVTYKIPLKTSNQPGPYGWPAPDYYDRVIDDLKRSMIDTVNLD